MKSYSTITFLAIAASALAHNETFKNYVYYDGIVPHAASTESQMCIEFNGAQDWYYRLSGPAGWSGSGSGSSFGGICFPTSTEGGAMFIGTDPNPPAGSTIIECQFPPSGSGNCDISLVDGYSLSIACAISSGTYPTIGGSVDLYGTGIACPESGASGICLNVDGQSGVSGQDASSQSQINSFFQPAVESGNDYCIWVNCDQMSYFPVGATVSCTVYS